jgi:bacteriocin biosynthesis cyclodehydratase domain-containing protein
MNNRRPRLAYPFTFLTQPDTVRLVAGEDYRYTLTGAGLDRWLPDFLARCKGRETLAALVTCLAEGQRDLAQQIVERLYGERVLVDGSAQDVQVARSYGRSVAGHGVLCERLRRELTPDEGRPRIQIYCQDRLDYSAALAANRNARQAGEALVWINYGALQRAYVSPLLLPDAGPCLACLLHAFQRLSPAPEIYDALLDHGKQQGAFAPAEFPAEGIDVLHALVRWKLAQAEAQEAPAALFRLQVFERSTFEVSTHRVFIDTDCPECRGGRR